MDLLIIVGPPAVGKMTVGKEVARLTGFRLFHNHVSADAVAAVFDWDSPPFWPLVDELRTRMFEVAAATGVDLIFTCAWDFANPGDRALVDRYAGIYESAGGRARFVELAADQAVRLARNGLADRRAAKRRSDEASAPEWIVAFETGRRLNSDGDFPYPEPDRYIRLDTTTIEPAAAARTIVAHFRLPPGT